MFAFFEKLIDPFPTAEPVKPPATLLAFIWHYARPTWPLLVLVALTGALFAVLEVALFGVLGRVVDWLSATDRASFWADHGLWLAGIGVLVLVIMPLIDLGHEMVTNQSIMGSFPMRVRWQAHRYLLRQSMGFFQDDFAGRVATKVMQTALAVRDCVALTTEVFVYVSVYFAGALVLFAQADWRLMVPLALWFAGYVVTLRYFIPRLRKIAKAQANARSLVTGRFVDSYTNIQMPTTMSRSRPKP